MASLYTIQLIACEVDLLNYVNRVDQGEGSYGVVKGH